MKYGILGDIHSNISALTAVMSCFEHEGVGRVLSVGDVVGYGGAPSDCIRLLRAADVIVVRGNHDAACVGQIDTACFNIPAREAIRWTQSVLSREECAWLSRLPLVHDLDECSVAHSTYATPELFDYVQTTSDADPSLDAMTSPVCFVGHTHVPVTLMRLREDPLHTAYTVSAEIDLSETQRALINVGSVGQPRDEDPRAAYCIYDSVRQSARIGRVAYDVEREAARIRSAGLPEVLANRLFLGV